MLGLYKARCTCAVCLDGGETLIPGKRVKDFHDKDLRCSPLMKKAWLHLAGQGPLFSWPVLAVGKVWAAVSVRDI